MNAGSLAQTEDSAKTTTTTALKHAARGLAIAASVLLAACGHHHNNGGGASGGVTTPATYLFFTGGASAALGAVDPANATAAGLITVEPNAATLSNINPVYGGVYNAAGLQVNGVHQHAVIYFKDVGGGIVQLFKVSALTGAAPTPIRVSSANIANSGATALCGVTVYSDFANADNSRVIYTQAGADAACSTADDLLSMATLSMDSATAPVPHSTAGAKVIKEIRDGTGAITGWIMLLGTNLMWYQTDMASATAQLLASSVAVTAASATASATPSPLASAAGKELLAVDTGTGPQVRIFDGTNTLKTPGNAATPLPAKFDCKADDTYLFCADTTATGRTIRRLPLDGGATWTAIYTGFAEVMTGIVLSENRVLFKDAQAAATGTLNLSSVPKIPYDPTQVWPVTLCTFRTSGNGGTDGDEKIIASGPNVYCSEVIDNPTTVSLVHEAGFYQVPITAAAGNTLYWTWQGGSARDVNEWQKVGRVIFVRQTSTDTTKLTSYDGPSGLVLADLTTTAQTGLTWANPLGDSNQGNTLLILNDGTGNGELFFANTSAANSLVRLTTTTSSEAFVGASGCTLGSSQSPDPMLPLLVAIAAFYLWRRRRVGR